MKNNTKKKIWPALVMILCLVIVGAWVVASKLAARKWDEFELTASSFKEFRPEAEGWIFDKKRLGDNPDPRTPNILAYVMKKSHLESGDIKDNGPVLIRLVHGYNMPDCMRIKHYEVKLIADTGGTHAGSYADKMISSEIIKDIKGGRIQVWLLTSPTGGLSIWITRMIRSVNFSGTLRDVRSMAFPRIGTPDSPAWTPEGLKLRSLKHPLRNFRLLIRSKWNASRRDLLTFLKLKQPAWASRNMLTLVGVSESVSIKKGEAGEVAEYVIEALNVFHRELKEFGKTEDCGGEGEGGESRKQKVESRNREGGEKVEIRESKVEMGSPDSLWDRDFRFASTSP